MAAHRSLSNRKSIGVTEKRSYSIRSPGTPASGDRSKASLRKRRDGKTTPESSKSILSSSSGRALKAEQSPIQTGNRRMTVDPADFDAMMRELAEDEDESAVDSVDVGMVGSSVHVNTTNPSLNQQSVDNRRDTLNSMVSEISTFSAGTGAVTFASTVVANSSMQSGPVITNVSTRPSMLSAHTNRTTTNRANNLSTIDMNKSQMSVNKSQMSAASEAISTASEAFERLANERRMTVDPTDLAMLDDTAIDTSTTNVDGISGNVSVGRMSMGTMGEDHGDGSTVFNDTNIIFFSGNNM